MKVADPSGTARNLRRYMVEKDVKASEITDYLGTSRGMVYRWREGVILPTLSHCVGICHVLGIKLDDLIAVEEDWYEEDE